MFLHNPALFSAEERVCQDSIEEEAGDFKSEKFHGFKQAKATLETWAHVFTNLSMMPGKYLMPDFNGWSPWAFLHVLPGLGGRGS